MKKELYALTTYCTMHGIDHSFITSLREEGLISIIVENNDEYIEEEQLQDLEIYTRWHHEMGINTEGIDVIRHLVGRLREVHGELNSLRARLKLYQEGF